MNTIETIMPRITGLRDESQLAVSVDEIRKIRAEQKALRDLIGLYQASFGAILNAADTIRRVVSAPPTITDDKAHHNRLLKAPVGIGGLPWLRMKEAPKDGTAILALMEASDDPHTIRWFNGGWEMVWDAYRLSHADGPRFWMPVPRDPEE